MAIQSDVIAPRAPDAAPGRRALGIAAALLLLGIAPFLVHSSSIPSS